MWQAAVAVNDMCVLKGQTGTAFGLGESILFLFFFLFCLSIIWGRKRKFTDALGFLRFEHEFDAFAKPVMLSLGTWICIIHVQLLPFLDVCIEWK